MKSCKCGGEFLPFKELNELLGRTPTEFKCDKCGRIFVEYRRIKHG
jgi:hypothetical protein